MKEIYLDAHASTPVDQSVIDTMMPYYTQYFGNGNHRNGWKANQALEIARTEVAQVIGAYPGEIFFTSGATEAINSGIIGLSKLHPEKSHVITQSTEHPGVLATMEYLKSIGYRLTMLEVNSDGQIDLDELEHAISSDTLVVAIMLANNEIGTIHPIEKIGAICHARDTKFFCDLTQGAGWHNIDMSTLPIDLACFSAHKMYGPKGIGALYYRDRKNLLVPLMHGGGQEKGFRSGTVNIPGAVGFGKACALVSGNKTEYKDHIKRLRDEMWHLLSNELEDLTLNGSLEFRHPGNLNFRIAGVNSEQLIGELPDLMLSNSSACSSGSTKPSHVLSAIGLADFEAKECIRIGIGKFNTSEEIAIAAKLISNKVKMIRTSILNAY